MRFLSSHCSSTESNSAGGNNEDVTTTSNNSTQTPSDLSPPGPNEEVLPQAHHQNPGHCIASFAAINQMRNNTQVCTCNISSTRTHIIHNCKQKFLISEQLNVKRKQLAYVQKQQALEPVRGTDRRSN